MPGLQAKLDLVDSQSVAQLYSATQAMFYGLQGSTEESNVQESVSQFPVPHPSTTATTLNANISSIRQATRTSSQELSDLILLRTVGAEAAIPPGIEKAAGVCGGAARIAHTRIPVWTLVRFRQLGATEKNIRSFYPTLTPVDIVHAWDYEAQHPDEIAASILQNEA